MRDAPWVSTGIKPLSANDSYMGRKVKSQAYRRYERMVMMHLPDMEVPEGPLSLKVWVFYSSAASDIDNCLKPFIDILQKRYTFNDNKIYELKVRKVIVPKGQETIKFKLIPYTQPTRIGEFKRLHGDD